MKELGSRIDIAKIRGDLAPLLYLKFVEDTEEEESCRIRSKQEGDLHLFSSFIKQNQVGIKTCCWRTDQRSRYVPCRERTHVPDFQKFAA